MKEHTDAVLSIGITEDSKVLVSGGADKTIVVWKMDTFEKIKVLEGHTGAVNSICVEGN